MNNQEIHPPIIAPSVLAADFSNLERELNRARESGADWIHLDPMDGHFVPNLTFGPFVVEAIRDKTELPLDTHLMLREPGKYLNSFIDAGTDRLSFQIEALFPDMDLLEEEKGYRVVKEPDHLDEALGRAEELISTCRNRDVNPGIVLNPPTPISLVEPLLSEVDFVLVMTVWPGFGGQSFMPEPLEKVRELSRVKGEQEFLIEVDGGISPETIGRASGAGADLFVSGSASFGAESMKDAIDEMRTIAEQHRT